MSAPTVVLKGLDSGDDIYLYWRWLDSPAVPHYAVAPAGQRVETLATLDAALPQRLSSDLDRNAAVVRAMTGTLFDPDSERKLATALGSVLLPEELKRQLRQRQEDLPDGVLPRLRIHPSESTARVPWELLATDTNGTRLLEVADVRMEVPLTVRSGRARAPEGPWERIRNKPALYVIDPPVSVFLPVLDALPRGEPLYQQLTDRIGQRRMDPDVTFPLEAAHFPWANRRWLGDRLRERPSRMLYFGHVTSADAVGDRPETTALHLADPADTFGMVNAIGDHRPLSTLDLFSGTMLADDAAPSDTNGADWTRIAGVQQLLGHEIWPMPPRVALLSCDSGTDHRFAEAFGLVVAMVNAGAELVTATRWPLPTDYAFEVCHGAGARPTSDLVAAVDRAHDQNDPIAALQAWQRCRLDSWRKGGQAVDSPILWAAVANYSAPAGVA